MAVPVAQVMGEYSSNIPTAEAATPLGMAGLILPDCSNQFQDSWEILGRDSQMLFCSLQPGEELTMQPGSMVHAARGVDADVTTGGFADCCKRSCMAGEEMFRLHYINKTNGPLSLSVTPPFPAKCVPVNLARYSGIKVAMGAFFAGFGRDMRFNFFMVRSLGMMLGAGNLFMTTISGTGMVFLAGGGTVIQKFLAQGEEYIIASDAFMAAEASVDISARKTGGCGVMCCGGEGLVNTVLKGPGMILFQSMDATKAALNYVTVTQKGDGGGGGGGGGG